MDLDDVLAATNEKVAEMHNEMYGTKMGLEDFDYCKVSLCIPISSRSVLR